jgi:hypothetical protein
MMKPVFLANFGFPIHGGAYIRNIFTAKELSSRMTFVTAPSRYFVVALILRS